ncbi:MAG: FAD-dependent oxidoreductase, partial [Rhodospirillaceae bacterium]|nr:FAD-dependent oxidoreductase [Rhodospirillaceae bacterium]
MRRLFGTERALAAGHAADQALEEVISFCAEHDIDAEIRRAGWLWGATLPETVGEWRPIMEMLVPHQVTPLRELAGEEIADRWGITGTLGGAIDERSGHLQPAKLVRGLRRVALEMGVEIHEGTAMTALGRGSPLTVTTPRGRVTANRVVLAIYAWAAQLPELRRSLVTVSYSVATTPVMTERLEQTGFANAPAFNETRNMINSLRPTVSGRALFGKPGTALSFGGKVSTAHDRDWDWNLDAERRRRELDPHYPGLSAAYAWSGPIDRTKDGLPFFGRLPGHPDILYATGFSGDGVGPCRLAGKVMAAMALDQHDEWADLGFVRP